LDIFKGNWRGLPRSSVRQADNSQASCMPVNTEQSSCPTFEWTVSTLHRKFSALHIPCVNDLTWVCG